MRNAGGSVTSSARDSSGVSMLRAAQLDSVHMVGAYLHSLVAHDP